MLFQCYRIYTEFIKTLVQIVTWNGLNYLCFQVFYSLQRVLIITTLLLDVVNSHNNRLLLYLFRSVTLFIFWIRSSHKFKSLCETAWTWTHPQPSTINRGCNLMTKQRLRHCRNRSAMARNPVHSLELYTPMAYTTNCRYNVKASDRSSRDHKMIPTQPINWNN
jgi:hypothetical protein